MLFQWARSPPDEFRRWTPIINVIPCNLSILRPHQNHAMNEILLRLRVESGAGFRENLWG